MFLAELWMCTYFQVKAHNCLPDTDDVCLHGYVLKIMNSLDSKAHNLIDAQHEMMVYLGMYIFLI